MGPAVPPLAVNVRITALEFESSHSSLNDCHAMHRVAAPGSWVDWASLLVSRGCWTSPYPLAPYLLRSAVSMRERGPFQDAHYSSYERMLPPSIAASPIRHSSLPRPSGQSSLPQFHLLKDPQCPLLQTRKTHSRPSSRAANAIACPKTRMRSYGPSISRPPSWKVRSPCVPRPARGV